MNNSQIKSVIDMTTGERIRYFRKKIGISQEELAARIYITKQTVSLYESDKIDVKVSVIKDIARALQVSAYYLIENNSGDVVNDDMTFDSNERKLITMFRQLQTRDKGILLEQCKAFFYIEQ